ncbi:PepSY domain-containing protein [uncultured Phascolarctobacterium sp.]|uniref:PepSY domain-containing protein n=1 Tax=uncultured Phascolarctobacterium sp. TaxID=512296 RepID=UPI0025FD7004|nr:PepSY domain-containing protein [uncultured Phascolarctobacterium sp.]
MKKIAAIITAGLATLAISVTAFAASLISADEALAIAQKEVPATSTHIYTKAENLKHYHPLYEVKFYDNTTNTEYEVEVLQATGAIKEFSMDIKTQIGSTKIILSANDVQAIVAKEYPDARIYKLELDNDDGLYEYEVKFHTPALRGEMTINPETGVIMEKDLKYKI